MFGIGFGEILIILLIAIVFIRPEDLPKFLRQAGRLYGQLKRMYGEIIKAKDKIIKEIDEATSLEEPSNTAVKAPPKSVKSDDSKEPKEEPAKLTETQESSSLTAPPKE